MKKIIRKINNIRKIIIIKHTIYSLIISLIVLLAVNETLPSIYTIVWIMIALAGAIIGGSATNAIVDMDSDKENHLKASRGMASGIVNKAEGIILAVIGYLLLILASVMLNKICARLSPLAVAILILEAYSKKITWAYHFFLGVASSAAPIGVWIALTGEISMIATILGIGNMLSIAASDIIYSIKSYDFNIENGVLSIPTRFGVEKSIKIARVIYYMATIVLIYGGLLSTKLGLLYYVMLIILIGTIYKTNRGIVFEYKTSLI